MQNTGNLKVTTPSDREIVMTRVFDAPRQLVFDGFIKLEVVKQWQYGPDDWTLAVCEFDLRPGGALRYEWRHTDGREMGMSGVYREIAPPERLVHTEIFDEDWTGGETLVTTTFDERDGKTTVAMTVLYSSREVRDMVLKTGMEHGMSAGYDRLEQLLPAMAATD
ncbi:MAG: SRPBCC family protein [Pirellulales bacterium]